MDARMLRELELDLVARLCAPLADAPAVQGTVAPTRAPPAPLRGLLAETSPRGRKAAEGAADAARWLFVDDGVDDRDAFAGAAGRLLDAMLAAVGCRRGDEHAATDPQAAGARVVVALGASAARGLLGAEGELAALRGQVHRMGGVPVIVTCHPADLLRTPADKALAWKDLLLARDSLSKA